MKPNEMGFTVIPNKVKTDNTISLLARFILGDIISFTNISSCYASNEYFSELYQVSKRRIEQCLKELVDKGYIYSIYNRKTRKRFLSPTSETVADISKVDIKPKETPKKEDESKKYQTTKIAELKKIWT